jgi:Zn-dependent protease
VLVPILTFAYAHWMMGWASAPYDPDWQRRYPRRAAWMALAGPGANFALVLIAALSIRIGIALHFFRMPQSATFTHIAEAAVPGTPELIATFLSVLFVLNLVLGTFNLLPVPPLDGHTGITLLMGEETALRFLEWSRRGMGMIGLLVAWIVYDKLFDHIFRLSLAALYPGSSWS